MKLDPFEIFSAFEILWYLNTVTVCSAITRINTNVFFSSFAQSIVLNPGDVLKLLWCHFFTHRLSLWQQPVKMLLMVIIGFLYGFDLSSAWESLWQAWTLNSWLSANELFTELGHFQIWFFDYFNTN